MEKKRLDYLDGLKALACIGVFLTHFYGAFNSPMLSREIAWVNTDLLKILLDGDFQIGLFCAISGYLASKTKIDGVSSLLRKSFLRYLRFVLPIFIVCLVVFIIQKLIGFHNGEAGRILYNSWFGGYYSADFSLFDLIASPLYRIWLFADDSFNGPFWMLADMLWSSMIIYSVSFLGKSLPKYKPLFYAAALAASYFISYVCFAVLIGAGIGYFIGELKSGKGVNFICFAGIVFIIWLMYGGHNALLLKLSPESYLEGRFTLNGYFKAVYASLLFLFISGTKYIKAALGTKPMAYLGKLSFPVYCFHWPVICSFAAMVFVAIREKLAYSEVYLITFAVALVFTFGISFLFVRYAEPALAQPERLITFVKRSKQD